MAKANYKYDKRQRDIAKQKKQEEKRQKKLAKKAEAGSGTDGVSPAPTQDETP
ncbi:MAG: hypothetical protein ACRESC_05455 [Gammaproteobacteria bacterium]